MPTRGELIGEALDTFLQSCSDLEGTAVVSADGLPMASALPAHLEDDRIAAMSAALMSLGEKASEQLGRGRLSQVFIEGDNGFVYLMSAGPSAVLTAVSRVSAKIGLILYEMRGAAAAVAAALAQPAMAPRPVAPAPAPPAPPAAPPPPAPPAAGVAAPALVPPTPEAFMLGGPPAQVAPALEPVAPATELQGAPPLPPVGGGF